MAALLWLNNTLLDMKRDVGEIKSSMRSVWTLSDMQLWEAGLKASNMNLALPGATETYRKRTDRGSIQ